MKQLILLTIFLQSFFTATAQGDLDALFHALPPVPQHSAVHGPQTIEAFDAKCQAVLDRVDALLNRVQAQRKDDFKPIMDRQKKQAEIVAKMTELADKGELTDQKAQEFARQMDHYEEPESAPPATADIAVQNTINEFRMRFEQAERDRLGITLNPPAICQETDKLEEQYRQAKYNGGDLTRARANLARAWKERRRIFSAHNAEYLQKMHTMIRENWSVLKKDQEQAAGILRHYLVDMKDFYSFHKITMWERYLDEYGLKNEDI